MKYFFLSFSLIISACYTSQLFAQEKPILKVGDAAEMRVAGDVTKGIIVGPYEKNEWGYATYQFHAEGEKYCSNHRLDTRINAEFIFPVAAGTKTATAVQTANTKPVNPASSPTAVPMGAYKKGDEVLYSQTLVWSKGIIKGYEPEKRRYLIEDVYVSIPCFAVTKPAATYNNDFYLGSWQVSIGGAMYSTLEKNKIYTNVSGGMKLHTLIIKADGTYSWKVASNKVLQGKWKPRPNLPGIIILKGIDGLDWTVYETTEAFATTSETKDEIRFHHEPTSTGYYRATRIGPNKSCLLVNRKF